MKTICPIVISFQKATRLKCIAEVDTCKQCKCSYEKYTISFIAHDLTLQLYRVLQVNWEFLHTLLQWL